MKRYEVTASVTYVVDAHSDTEAFEKIADGAEFPVVPYDENTYCNKIEITEVKEI